MSTGPDSEFAYVGDELELFAAATTWKSYLRDQIRPHLGKQVLEVGAGLGATTLLLCDGSQERWVCLEPDGALASRVAERIRSRELPPACVAATGMISTLPSGDRFDTILYVDVLEHIEQDREEVEAAAARLVPGGRLVVLAPAHQSLFTPFDRAIGHFRRYNLNTLTALTPASLTVVTARYLDTVGLLASLGNRLLLKSAMPTAGQIAFWDRVLVRTSRVIDPILRYRWGKSVLVVWQKR